LLGLISLSVSFELAVPLVSGGVVVVVVVVVVGVVGVVQ
jgi:hypothetical protein